MPISLLSRQSKAEPSSPTMPHTSPRLLGSTLRVVWSIMASYFPTSFRSRSCWHERSGCSITTPRKVSTTSLRGFRISAKPANAFSQLRIAELGNAPPSLRNPHSAISLLPSAPLLPRSLAPPHVSRFTLPCSPAPPPPFTFHASRFTLHASCPPQADFACGSTSCLLPSAFCLLPSAPFSFRGGPDPAAVEFHEPLGQGQTEAGPPDHLSSLDAVEPPG